LEGLEYVPLFDYFVDRKKDGCFRVICGDHVTNDTGTGIVHTAPGFGVDDYNVCIKNKIIKPDDPLVPIDEEGKFTDQVKEYKGISVKEADKLIKKDLKKQGRLIIDS
jgi:isoleucyl-tRNA synthetase